MPNDRVAFIKPYRIEETPAAFRIVDAKGRNTGIMVFFSGWSTIAGNVVRVPDEDRAREIAEKIVKAL